MSRLDFTVQQAPPAGNNVNLTFASLAFLMATAAYAPPVGAVAFGPSPDLFEPGQTDLNFVEQGAPPAGNAVDLTWPEAALNFQHSPAAYTPPVGECDFGPGIPVVPLDFEHSPAPYQPPQSGVRIGPDPKPTAPADFTLPAAAYFPPWNAADFPWAGDSRDLPAHQPPPGVDASFGLRWGTAALIDVPLSPKWGNLPHLDRSAGSAWGAGAHLDAAPALPWGDLAPADVGNSLNWGLTDAVPSHLPALVWLYPKAEDRGSGAAWRDASPIDPPLHRLDWLYPSVKDTAALMPFESTQLFGFAGRDRKAAYIPEVSNAVDLAWGAATVDFEISRARCVPQHSTANFQMPPPQAVEPIAGDSVDLVWGVLDPPKALPQPTGSVALMPWKAPIANARSLALNWGPGSPLRREYRNPWQIEPDDLPPDYPPILPNKEVYTVSNNLSVVRLPGREPLQATAVGVSLDRDSNAWSARIALGDDSSFLLIDPATGLREVEITMNGFTFVVIAERADQEMVFGQRSWVVRGRGLSAELAAPYALPRTRQNDSASNSAQLADAEVFGTGWTVEWDLPVWNVGAGEFSYSDLTPVQAVGLLASAVGGVIRPDAANRTLYVESRLPINPDDWAAAVPNVIVPEAICEQIASSYEPQPDYNWIFCSGGAQGISAEITRAGTAGDKPAPDIVDPLFTAIEAPRERARVALYGSGSFRRATLTIPLLPTPGVCLPNALVEVSAPQPWRGLVESIDLTAAVTDDGELTIFQNVTIERRS